MLADFVRKRRTLTGTKIVCAEGDCGACTVLVARPGAAARGHSPWTAVNSCTVTLAQLDGASVVTVEALSGGRSELATLTPVQSALRECHASQCGFCTPGFVMALTGLVEKKKCADAGLIGAQEAKNALTGNLCRCTGYQPIIDAACRVDARAVESLSPRFWSASVQRDLKRELLKPLAIEGAEFSFRAPRSLREVSRVLLSSPRKNKNLPGGAVRILAAGTDLGVVQNKQRPRALHAVSLHLLPELARIQVRGERVEVGARVTLTELRQWCKKRVPEFARFLDLFASPQIKNVATLVGNVANASPIGDTPPFLLVSNAEVIAQGPRGARRIPLTRFYTGYRQTALRAGEWIRGIAFDIPARTERLRLYKVSQRKDLDISTISLAARASRKGAAIQSIALAMGGVAATPVRLPRTEAALRGRNVDGALLRTAAQTLQAELKPLSDLRASAAYRRVAAEGLLRRFLREELA